MKRTFLSIVTMANRPALAVSAMSFRASHEHPLSIHLASVGGLRKVGVWKYAAMIVLFLILGIGNAWGGAITGAYSYVKTQTASTAEGLVYCNKSSAANPSPSDYKRYYPGGSATDSGKEACYVNLGAAKSGVYIYCWAMPARGYEFDHWDGYEKGYLPYGDQNKSKLLDINSWNGVGDQMVGTCGNGASTWVEHQAYFRPATSYTITYKSPVGGSYSVSYSYLKTRKRSTPANVNNSNANDGTYDEYEFYTDDSESYSMTPSSENTPVTSYAADVITLSVPADATNFIGWYEDDVKIEGSETKKTLTYTAHANVTIEPKFKELAWGEVTGDVTTNVTAKGTYDSRMVYVAIPTLIGSWTSADFTVTPINSSNSFGSIAIGTVSLNETESRLEIPYTYTATNWGGIEAALTITPTFGATKEFSIACSAEEVVDYQACIEENEVRTYTGTLADMMVQANSMTNKPTLKLMQDKEITVPLSFTKSFTFDVNGKVLTASCASAFSIDAAGIDVQIIDGSFTQVGEIHTSYSSSSNVNVVTFTQAAKLTMQGGTLSVENTGAGSAYGIDVRQGSVFYMTGGDLTVSSTSGSAEGVHVATTADYATLNGGSIAVTAPANAYGLWSAGQSNITNAIFNVETTTGANAYGIYVNSGVSTVTTTNFTVNANTTGAYGAYINNDGRLNANGGSFAATAVEDKAYGVYVASSGATAMLQQKTVVTAEVTTGNGTDKVEVCGVHNLGTASLSNISVTATNNSTTATASTNYSAAISTNTGAISTTIENGTYTANAETGYVYAIRHRHGNLTVDDGTFKGILKTSGVGAYGAHLSSNAAIANATLYGETKGSGSKAHGVVGNAGTITLTNCDLTGKSNTNIAYAIYSRANVSAAGCTLTALTTSAAGTDSAYGLYAEDGNNSLTNCNATVTARTVSAYGVYHKAGSLIVNGGQYDVVAEQATAIAPQNSQLYGLYNEAGKTITVSNAIFTAIAANASYSQNVYGALIYGTLNSTGATYTAEAKLNVYGVYGNTASTLNMARNTISARATNGTKSYGVYAKKNFTIDNDIVRADATSTDVYALYFDATNSVGEVLDGKFYAMGNGTNTFGSLNAAGTVGNVKLKGGIYSSIVNLDKYAATGYDIYHLDNSHPDFADGYRFIVATSNPSPYVCYIKNGNRYETLEAALQYTKDNSGSNYTIVMSQNYTLPAGDYELPSNATLLVPRSADATDICAETPARRSTTGVRAENIRLTLASDAHLDVNGKIEVGGEMYCQESGQISYINSEYGHIFMDSRSLIQLNSGAKLYAWGYITGTGEIKVKNNAEVHEMFQVGDMKPMSSIGKLSGGYYNNPEKYFLVNQYFIQNVEVPTTYYYNSRLIGAMSSYYSGKYIGDSNLKLVDTNGSLFKVTTNDESAWVRKKYDAEYDYQVWDINTQAELGSITLNLSGVPVLGDASFNSGSYILPITSNMKIHVLDGDFSITQSSQLLPGASIEVEKTASLIINSDKEVYVFDKDQWPTAIGTKSVLFSPSWTNGVKPTRTLDDADVNIHGKITVNGKLFTSRSLEGGTNTTNGANIYSNNSDAGTVAFKTNAASASTIELITNISGDTKTTKTVDLDPAKLKNGDGSYAETAGTESGESWVYMNNEWVKTYTNGCFEVIEDSEGATVYVKPSEYVALANKAKDSNNKWTGVAETNHTYLTVGGKILILMDDCQWWEVEATSDPAVFECKKEGYEGFYYYDTSANKWKLKTVSVKFYSAETGDDVLKTIVTDYNGIPDQAVIATNPTKATTAAATYTFYGWQSSVTGTTYAWTDQLEVATADMSYRPVFTEKARNYTITLNDANNGAAVPVEVAYGSVPDYTAKKDPTAQYTYSFDRWEPALAAVTGPATYTAIWNNIINRYNVTWMDGETVLETDKNLLYGTETSFDGTQPTKAADDNYAYDFSGWLNSLTGNMRANNETVTGAITYTAQYNTTPRYAVTFINYDGTQLQKEAVTQGGDVIYKGLTPGRARDLDGYYKFIGWRNSNGDDYNANAILPVVTGKETYTAQYEYVTELYTITLNNVDGEGTFWSGKFGVGSIPFYNRDNNDIAVEPTKASTAQYEYTFSGWTPELEAVSGEATYTAQFEQKTRKYEITFANLDGNGAQQTIEVAYGQTPVSPVTPEMVVEHTTYAFTGWDTDIVQVTGEATYTAQFSSTGVLQQFAITFDPDNGSATQVSNVDYGTMPTWIGAEPTKPADAQYTYTFAGWYPALAPVTEAAEYVATYTQSLNSYTVRFVNYDGTELKSSEFVYGATPTYSGETPKKPVEVATRKAYTFDGWSSTNGGPKLSSLPVVSGAATYYAHYSEATFVASVTPESGTPYYATSWTDAYNHISDDCTLKLYADASPSENTAINKNMTLDLNGYTLSRSVTTNSNTQLLNVSKVLTIIDSKESGNDGKISFSGSNSRRYSAIYVSGNGASLIVKGGIIEGKNTRSSSSSNTNTAAAAIENASSATVTIDGGDLTVTSTRGKVYAVYNGAATTVKSGKLYATLSGSTTSGSAYIFYSTNNVTLSGGYYSKDPGNITPATGYEKTTTTTGDPSGYTHKVVLATYTIGYTLNGGSEVANPTSYTIETETFTLNNPSKLGYSFAGWTGTGLSSATQTVTIATGTTGNRTYTATWTANTNTPYAVKHYKQALDGSYPETPDLTENLQGTTDVSVTPAVNEYTGFTAPATQTKAIAADGLMVIEYQYTRNSYELTWDANGGAIAGTSHTSGQVLYKAPITAPANANVTRPGYEFAGWNATLATTMPAEQLTYTAQWTIDANLVVDEGEPVVVEEDAEVTTTTVHTGAQLTVDEGKTLATNIFVIEAINEVTDTDEAFAAAKSGSGEAVGNIEADVMYFDLILNNPSNRRWNAFTVPFVVDLRKSGHTIQINDEPLTLGRGYDIVYYDGAVRAAEGKTANCWKYVEDEDSVLYPGKAYMIASASRAIRKVRFTKATDPTLVFDGKVSVAANATEIATGNNGGWNGIGNPKMYHAVINADATVCQVHDGGLIGSDGYRTYDMDERKLVVGKAVFVQVDSDDDDVSVVQATDQETIKPQAPRRTRQQIMEDRYDVQIAADGYASADRLLILAEEDKEDKYVILKDLSKAGVSPVRAQMWVDRYGEKLCMNTTALIDNKAEYPLTISVPKAGEYNIFVNGEVKENTTLYLTYNGRAIWNLNYGDYTATLENGMDSHYGLRLVQNASQVATGFDEAVVDARGETKKVLIEDKVYIIRSGEVYSIDGQLVK